ncbi:alpha mannosidase-like protein [Gryganskiella cystojenkinii]|nr:alpha mannosidase-like protein [Gryganskiella cystojenkinii]
MDTFAGSRPYQPHLGHHDGAGRTSRSRTCSSSSDNNEYSSTLIASFSYCSDDDTVDDNLITPILTTLPASSNSASSNVDTSSNDTLRERTAPRSSRLSRRSSTSQAILNQAQPEDSVTALQLDPGPTIPPPPPAVNGGNGTMKSWFLFFLFAFIQFLLSSPHPSNGVNANSDQDSGSISNNGGVGNSGQRGQSSTGSGSHGGAGSNSRQYFRDLPPITNHQTAHGKIVLEPMTETRRLILRQEAKDMFMHGYQGYLNYAFPKDELNPVACIGRGADKRNPNNINVNDVLGDFSLTLIDALDTLAAMREPEMFRNAIKLVRRHVFDFNIDSRVQVFEVNIRVLGALLSGHLYASDPKFQSLVKGYNGELLTMATDLGKRLIKAFENTPTGIPWPRVNLRRGVLWEESSETCVAGAGSLLLEFGVLSRLTGDPSFEDAAKKALFELWSRRSHIGLVGNTINITSGEWMSLMTGIGAGTDSFYEYLLKSYVLFGEDEYLDMYETAQDAIKRNLLHDSKYFYKQVHLHDGTLLASWVDSLSAFMPGVQVLGGDLESAIKNHLYYYNIWRKYQAIPERFNFITQTVDISNYPLRPEFIESNYFLYRATKDPFYLQVGEMILRDLQSYTKTKCGWASLQSVIDKKLEDRMESFALSETFKYLFLLFDEENILHQELRDSNFVFTTEGHVLALGSQYLNIISNKDDQDGNIKENQDDQWQRMQQHQQVRMKDAGSGKQHYLRHQNAAASKPRRWLQCPVYRTPDTFLKNIPYRPDADFARQMVGTRPDARDIVELDPKGYCEKPSLELERVFVEFSGPPKKTYFGNGGHGHEDTQDGTKESAEERQKRETEEDEKLGKKKLMVIPIQKGVFVSRIIGVRMQLQYDGVHNAYRAVKVDDYPLTLNSNVYIDRSSMRPLWDSYQRSQDAHLRIYKAISSPASESSQTKIVEKDLLIRPAEFGYWRPLVVDYTQDRRQVSPFNAVINTRDKDSTTRPSSASTASAAASNSSQGRIETTNLIRIHENTSGCRPFSSSQSKRIRGNILVVDRGGCLFILKAFYAQAAGASSIVVINSEETAFAMTGHVDSSPASPSHEQEEDMGPQIEEEQTTTTTGPNMMGEGILDDDIDIHTVMVGYSEGQTLLSWIREVEDYQQRHGEGDSGKVAMLIGGFVQSKVSKEQLDNARLSYNSLPIVNILTMPSSMATYG